MIDLCGFKGWALGLLGVCWGRQWHRSSTTTGLLGLMATGWECWRVCACVRVCRGWRWARTGCDYLFVRFDRDIFRNGNRYRNCTVWRWEEYLSLEERISDRRNIYWSHPQQKILNGSHSSFYRERQLGSCHFSVWPGVALQHQSSAFLVATRSNLPLKPNALLI